MTTVLTYAGRAWSVLFLLVVLFIAVALIGGRLYDWREARRKRAGDVARVEELLDGLHQRPFADEIAKCDIALWDIENEWSEHGESLS